MYQPKRLRKKSAVLTIALAIVLLASVAGTVAYLFTSTPPVVNMFTPTEVPNKIEEQISNGVKENVKVKNTGDIDAYIRANVIVSWVKEDDPATVYGQKPTDSDYTITWKTDGWVKGSDGFYYYKAPVAAGETTGELFTDCKSIGNHPAGYVLSVEIMAQSIQADGTDDNGTPAVELAWKIVTVNPDKTLTVQ